MTDKTPEQIAERIALERIGEAAEQGVNDLDLSELGLTTLPPEISQVTNLSILNLSRNKLTDLPSKIGQLVNLSSLRLSHNQLAILPHEIGQLVNLQELILHDNELTTLPSEVGQLTNLRTLVLGSDVSGNKLTALPPKIGNLINLRQFDVDNNNLSVLPPEIESLSELHRLGVSRNQLTSLPLEIGKLVNLKSLRASFNHLASLSHEIGKLLRLQELWLNGNKISSLPREIMKLANLRVLDLTNNPLLVPPEILSRVGDPTAIFTYYFGLEQVNRKKINQSKLLILGQGSVGKTSLIQQILHGTFDPGQTKTEGISINQLQLDDVLLNIWDFGGQEIMHATHQFFLTKRSLYLLVLDSRLTQEENRVENWLKIIQSFGGESPVLIVGNKIDQHPLDIDRTGLQKKYPNIVGILETSAATGTGIEALKVAITEQVNKLPHVRDLLPETWFSVKTKLEELGRQSNFITQEKYLGLCAENEVSDETSQRTLIGFLHDLGVVLHFQDDPRLEALGILNPQWVTNGVYKILNSHTLFQNKGVLTVSMLDEILNLPEYPRGKRLFIVDMMKKFELCYDIEPDKTFLVPDLLPKDEPVTNGHESALAFQYHYTVLPSSVITRFIVRMNEFVHEKVWRSGVALKDGGNIALVKADTEDRKVFIWVSGDEHKRHDFLSKIRGQFDAIHKTISKLGVKEMVPVSGHPEAEPVDYDLLLQMDHNNVEVYPVLSGGKMIVVKVREMLNGVARQDDRQRGNITNFYIGGDVKDSTIISGDENEVKK